MSIKPSGGKMRITEVNPHLICALCGGYLIDATTIVECLHSFCKTCIIRYLETSKYCPICEVLIHKTRPWQNIKLDDTLQNIVYKLVPGLFQREMKRRREYYDQQPVQSKSHGKTRNSGRIIFSADEEFSVSLEFWPEGPNSMETECKSTSCDKLHDRRYLLCPAELNMSHLKRFIRNKYSLSDRYQIDIYHTSQPLRDTFTLVDVAYIYSWRREGILRLFYAFYLNETKKIKLDVVDDVEGKMEVEHIKLEPQNMCKDIIFEKGISIIETEKKPRLLPKPVPNGDVVNVPPTQVNEVTKSSALPESSEPSRQETKNTNINDIITNNDYDDDDENEFEMQIVVEEIEIDDDPEPNLEIVIDDKPDPKVPEVSVTRPQIPQQSQPKPETKPEIIKIPVAKTAEVKDSNRQDRVNNNSPEKLSKETKPNPVEQVKAYVKTQLSKSPIKDNLTQSNTKPSFKDSSLQISRSTVKDTASLVVTSAHKEPTSRPASSPVKDIPHRVPMSPSEPKDTSSRPIISSSKDAPSRLLMTSPKDIQSRPYMTSLKDTTPNLTSQSKKDVSSRPSINKESPTTKTVPSPKKDSVSRPMPSHTSSRSTPSHSKDSSRSVTAHSHLSTMTSPNKDSFSRPLPSPKKELFSHITTSPIRTSASHHTINTGKDVASRIPNTIIKDTAAQIGKSVHKDTVSHSHSIKSMIKNSTPNPNSIASHIKHVPQVPRLVKTPIQQIKPPTLDSFSPQTHHNMAPKWQPHRDGFYNGHYKPPQEKPLELKREPVPLDYSKPS